MEYSDELLDKTKYFIDLDRNKIYARKGYGHRELAYKIISRAGLDSIYYEYEEKLSPVIFLICCGYVVVDEAEEKIKFKERENFEMIKYTTVGYCSLAIDEEYIKYIKDEYENETNSIGDFYNIANIKEKQEINEIINKVKDLRKRQTKEDEER